MNGDTIDYHLVEKNISTTQPTDRLLVYAGGNL